MKNILKYNLLGLIALGLFFSNPSKAQAESEIDPFVNIYTVAEGFGDEVLQDTFSLDETPYLFVEFADALDSDFIHGDYYPQSGDFLGSTSVTDIGISTKFWFNLEDWDSNKSQGIWQIDTDLSFGETAGHSAPTSFTVTPEPISTALFLIGGAPIALSLYRRRKFRV